MSDSQRIEEIKNFLNLSARAIASEIGLGSPQIFYDIKAGKCGISKDLASKIQERYVNFNLSWVLTGEGEMLKNSSEIIDRTKKSDTVSMPADVWAVISSQAESLKMKDEQINEVLASLKSKDRQVEEVIELLKEQLKKGRDATMKLRAANLVVEEDE